MFKKNSSQNTRMPKRKRISVLTAFIVFILAVSLGSSSDNLSKYFTEFAQEAFDTEENLVVSSDKNEIGQSEKQVLITKSDQKSLLSANQKTVSNRENKKSVKDSNLEVHFINVDQADATLFICDGEAMLLDAGNNTDGTKIQLYLNKQGVKSLKYLILTHPDADHIGGADVIITKFPVENVFMTNYVNDTKTYKDVIDALEYKKLKWSTPSVGDTYSLGGANFTILSPNKKYDDPNEASISLMLHHEENSFLFTGDAEQEAEADILKTKIDIDCDVFKAGHHGSKTSNSREFLKKVSPEFVVVSCGEENTYGHPHAQPMNYFRSMGIKLFRTDDQGTITVASDGKKMTWNMSPSENWAPGEPKGESSAKSSSQSIQKSVKNTTSSAKSNEKPTQSAAASVQSTKESTENTLVPAQSTQEPIQNAAASVQSVQEPIQQTQGSFAVNNKNGKVHMVGQCAATKEGHKNQMTEAIYFNTYEEAEAYSKQAHPKQDKIQCGNCWK